MRCEYMCSEIIPRPIIENFQIGNCNTTKGLLPWELTS